MPDWLTHVLFAWIIVEVVFWKTLNKKILSLAMLGAIMPDIDKIMIFGDRLVAAYPSLQFIISHGITHTLAIALLSIFIASFWKKDFRMVVGLLIIGNISHLFLDTFSIGSGIMWLWPLSWERFTLPLYWSDFILLPLIMIICLGFIKILKGELSLKHFREFFK